MKSLSLAASAAAVAIALLVASCSPSKKAEDVVKTFAKAAVAEDNAKMMNLYPGAYFLNDSLNSFNLASLADLTIEYVSHSGGVSEVMTVTTKCNGREILWDVVERGGEYRIVSTRGLFEYDLSRIKAEDDVTVDFEYNYYDPKLAKRVKMVNAALPIMKMFTQAVEQGDTASLRKLYPKAAKCLERLTLGKKLVLGLCEVFTNDGYDDFEVRDVDEDDYVSFRNSDVAIHISPLKGVVVDSRNLLSADVEKKALDELDSYAPSQAAETTDFEYIGELKTKIERVKEDNARKVREEKERLEREAEKARQEKERQARVAKWKSQGAAILSHSMVGNNDGKGIKVSVGNLSNKTIKYVHFTVQGYNTVDDPVGYPQRVNGIGPVNPDRTAEWEFSNIWTYNPSIIKYYKIKSMTVDFKEGGSKTITNPEIFPSDYKNWYY